MRVFVTGGTGFLGKRVARALLARGHDVSCLVRGGDVSGLERCEIVRGSLERVEGFEGCDVVVHAAAAMTGGAATLFLNNVVATRRLVRVAMGAGARRFVLVSSMGVYGTEGLGRGDVLDETCGLDSRPHLRDAYSYSKVEQEKVCWEAHGNEGLPLAVVRPGVIYGPGRGCLSSRIGLQVGSWMLKMGGGQRVPYTYVDNCAEAIALAVSAPNIDGQAINVVDDDLPTASEVLRRYRKDVRRLGVMPVPSWLISPLSGLCEWYHRRSNGQLPAVLTRYKSAAMWKRLEYSNDKAKVMLAWTPRVGFEEGLRRSCEWSRGVAA